MPTQILGHSQETRKSATWLRTAGIGSTEHVQLCLGDVFVMPQAKRERRAGKKWATAADEQLALLDERLRNEQITHAEYEAFLDRLVLARSSRDEPESSPVAVAELVRTCDRLVVLGDPGTGKTTLMSYLALRHARARLDGEPRVSAELWPARLPLYVRAGDFSRWLLRVGHRALAEAELLADLRPMALDRSTRPLLRTQIRSVDP